MPASTSVDPQGELFVLFSTDFGPEIATIWLDPNITALERLFKKGLLPWKGARDWIPS